MTTNALLRAIILTAAVLLGSAGACQAQMSTARVSYFRDRFGNLTGARYQIVLPTVNRFYDFTAPAVFLNLPIATQVALLDQRFGIGADAVVLRNILQNDQQQRRDQDMRNQQEQLRQMADQRRQQEAQMADQRRQQEESLRQMNQQQMNQQLNRIAQPPITIPRPMVYQPPITIPQAPAYRPPVYQPPITFPR